MTTPRMTTPRRGRRAAASTETEPENPIVSDETNVAATEEPAVIPDAENVGETDEGTETAARRGRTPMDAVERQKRLNYRAATKATELLEGFGFTVTAPDGWEDPEIERKRENARKALEALRAAGVDVSGLLSE